MQRYSRVRRLLARGSLAAVAVLLIGAGGGAPAARGTQQTITPGSPRYGQLEPSDRTVDGRRYDDYRYRGRAGETLSLRLWSATFASRLDVWGPGGFQTARASAPGRYASFEYRLPANGPVIIRASSARTGVTGAYALDLDTDRNTRDYHPPFPPPPPPPTPLLRR